MKFKFNLKLTAFLVSLFIGLLLLILGNKNIFCLSFGLIIVGLSFVVFVLYFNSKAKETYAEIEKQIEDIDNAEEELEEDEDNDELFYYKNDLYTQKRKLLKKQKSLNIILYLGTREFEKELAPPTQKYRKEIWRIYHEIIYGKTRKR